MNNKTLIIAIAILVITGGILLIGGQFLGKDKNSAKKTMSEGTLANEEISTVQLTSSGFNPQTINIKTGTRVIWSNKSGKEGTVNSADHPTHQINTSLNLGGFPDGSTVQLVFDKSGTYKYHNHLNPSQMGTVVVK